VAKTEPEMAPNRSGVTVPPGNTGLADAGVVGAHKNEAASAIATTPSCSDFMPSRALPRLRSDKAANKFDVSAGKSRRCAGHHRQDRGQYQNRAGGNRPLTLPQAWPAKDIRDRSGHSAAPFLRLRGWTILSRVRTRQSLLSRVWTRQSLTLANRENHKNFIRGRSTGGAYRYGTLRRLSRPPVSQSRWPGCAQAAESSRRYPRSQRPGSRRCCFRPRPRRPPISGRCP